MPFIGQKPLGKSPEVYTNRLHPEETLWFSTCAGSNAWKAGAFHIASQADNPAPCILIWSEVLLS